MSNTEIITIIPSKLAKSFAEQKKIENYNNLPQISTTVMKWIREYMVENVGYSNLPMAGISGLRSSDSEDLLHVIPGKPDESVLLQLEVPDDLIISITYSRLLEFSDKTESASSVALDILHEEFIDALDNFDADVVSDSADVISFIPFLDFSRCKCYALLNENFQIGDFKIEGLPEKSFKQVASFYQ